MAVTKRVSKTIHKKSIASQSVGNILQSFKKETKNINKK